MAAMEVDSGHIRNGHEDHDKRFHEAVQNVSKPECVDTDIFKATRDRLVLHLTELLEYYTQGSSATLNGLAKDIQSLSSNVQELKDSKNAQVLKTPEVPQYCVNIAVRGLDKALLQGIPQSVLLENVRARFVRTIKDVRSKKATIKVYVFTSEQREIVAKGFQQVLKPLGLYHYVCLKPDTFLVHVEMNKGSQGKRKAKGI